MSNPELADLTPWRSDEGLEPDREFPWTSRADLRMPFDMESNDDVTDLVISQIQATMPGLLQRVEFDPEMSCFYVYGKTEQDCKDVCAVIFALVADITPL